MNRVRRFDSHGKTIVHGMRYLYFNDDPWATSYAGVIKWDRDILCHVFYPDDEAYRPIIVHYWIAKVGDEKWLNASGFVREPKVRVTDGKRNWVVQDKEILS